MFVPQGISLKELEQGVEFESQEDAMDSDEDAFDDVSYDHFLDNITDPDRNKPQYYSGDVPFSVLKEEMTPLTEDGRVLKQILKSGTGLLIPDKSVVLMHYNAHLENNAEPFDSTIRRHKPFKFLFGDSNVIRGLELGVKTMKKGEISQILVGPEYAYGALGCAPRIPGNSEILYDVEILNFYECKDAIEFEEMSKEDQQQAPFQKVVGIYNCENEMARDLFRKKMYRPAIARYRKAVRLLEIVSVEDEKEDIKRNKYLLKLYLNLSQCFLNVENPEKAVIYADLALKIDSENHKGLFRMGCGLFGLGEYNRAKVYLFRARQYRPCEKVVNRKIAELEAKHKVYKEWEREVARRAFGEGLPLLKKSEMPENVEFANTIREEFVTFAESAEPEFQLSAGYTEDQLEVVKELAQDFNFAFVSKIQYSRKINKVAKRLKN